MSTHPDVAQLRLWQSQLYAHFRSADPALQPILTGLIGELALAEAHPTRRLTATWFPEHVLATATRALVVRLRRLAREPVSPYAAPNTRQQEEQRSRDLEQAARHLDALAEWIPPMAKPVMGEGVGP